MRLPATITPPPAQILLAWVMPSGRLGEQSKAASVEHVKENAGALDITLTAQDLLKLERAFPAPLIKRH
jgi:diketogulonate reductase-like aldo/keto reductase